MSYIEGSMWAWIFFCWVGTGEFLRARFSKDLSTSGAEHFLKSDPSCGFWALENPAQRVKGFMNLVIRAELFQPTPLPPPHPAKKTDLVTLKHFVNLYWLCQIVLVKKQTLQTFKVLISTPNIVWAKNFKTFRPKWFSLSFPSFPE